MQNILSIKNKTEVISALIFRHKAMDIFYIVAGVMMASIGLKGFLLPNDFLDGGAMGVSLLSQMVTGIDLSLLVVLVNLPFILMGAKQLSWGFAIKSAVAVVALATLVHLLEFPVITSDKLLISVFGGFFLGAGIGLTIRGGAVIDGTEVLAITISRKSSLTVGDFISLFNIILFSVAALIVNIETAMYSMLTYFAASKTVDFIINGIEEYIGVMIISDHYMDLRHAITQNLGRGVTVFKSDGGFGKKGCNITDRDVLFCVVTRLELTKIMLEIEKVDSEAFVIQYPIKDTKGGMIKKRPMHD